MEIIRKSGQRFNSNSSMSYGIRYISPAIVLLLSACSRDVGNDGQHTQVVPQRTTVAAGNDAERSKLLDAIAGNLRSVRKDTPPTDLSLVGLRENPSALLRRDVILEIDRNMEIMRNPEMERIVYELYLAEISAGRFWTKGAWLIARSGNQSRASTLLEHWKSSAPSSTANLESVLGAEQPKVVLAAVLFDLGEDSSISGVWATFPSLSEVDQLLVAQAAQGVLDVSIARDLVDHLDVARSEAVVERMVYAANSILYHIISSKTANDDWIDRETRRIMQELERRGVVLDFLRKIAEK